VQEQYEFEQFGHVLNRKSRQRQRREFGHGQQFQCVEFGAARGWF
jgi:hypothetical protein